VRTTITDVRRFLSDECSYFSLSAYVPNVAASRGVYRSGYARPVSRYAARPPLRPVVPGGRAPGGAGLLAAILGPIGGLTGCLCCLNTIGVWGLFITAIPLAVFISKSRRGRSVPSTLSLFNLFKVDGIVITRIETAMVLKNFSFHICY
jgi:hypothetical protein